jgi:hypothetical protein
VKLDAEGEEINVLAGAQQFFAQQSPVVMFEFKHGHAQNTPLLQAWQALGFGLFRWSAELALLLPFDPQSSELDFALNLIAIRPDSNSGCWSSAACWSLHGQLAAEPARKHTGTRQWSADWLCAQPAMQGPGARPRSHEPGGVYERSLRAVCAVHGARCAPTSPARGAC